MKISYLWLKELLPGLKASPKQVAEKLTAAGLEVESIDSVGERLKNIIVGEVTEVQKHPKADRLSVCKVFDGKEILQIVCGAPNVCQGKKYPLAQIGAKLPNGIEIKKATLRGVESSGMLCSADELGLPPQEGILELPEPIKAGNDFAKNTGLNDFILEVSVTPNRSDCLSHKGIAREVAAIFGLKYSPSPSPPPIKGGGKNKTTGKIVPSLLVGEGRGEGGGLKVKIRDSKGCRRYCAQIIRGVRVAPSPLWLRTRLHLLGQRSVNNIVDAVNLVMLKTGHPLHAFDHRFIRGSILEIKKCGASTSFTTLDSQKRDLLPDDLVIADSEGAVALAGIMGGKNSEIRNDTVVLVLEAASFNPIRIRKTAKRLSLQTDSSYRFERGVVAFSVKQALDELADLICGLAGGEASTILDLYPRKEKPLKLKLRDFELARVLGAPPSRSVVKSIFTSLQMKPVRGYGLWHICVPPYRTDLTREIDLIEEVVRFVGFNQIPSVLPATNLHPVRESPQSRHEDELRDFFTERGFFETIHLSFCEGEFLKLQNPLNQEMSSLRASLMPGLLSAYVKNKKGIGSFARFFELGNVFAPNAHEMKKMAGILGGNFFPAGWQSSQKECDFFTGKGILEAFFSWARIPDWHFEAGSPPSLFHPAQSLQILSGDKTLGHYGRIHPETLSRHEISIPLYYFDLDYDLLASLWGRKKAASLPLSPYPRIQRDLALIVDGDLSYHRIEEEIRKKNVPWLVSSKLFDLYTGDKISAGKKSMAFSLTYENHDRTLTDDEVNKVHFELVDYLKKQLGVELR